MYMTTPSYKVMLETIHSDEAITKSDLIELISFAIANNDICSVIDDYYRDNEYDLVEDYDRVYDEWRENNE